jgi:hypothetical protein
MHVVRCGKNFAISHKVDDEFGAHAERKHRSPLCRWAIPLGRWIALE